MVLCIACSNPNECHPLFKPFLLRLTWIPVHLPYGLKGEWVKCPLPSRTVPLSTEVLARAYSTHESPFRASVQYMATNRPDCHIAPRLSYNTKPSYCHKTEAQIVTSYKLQIVTSHNPRTVTSHNPQTVTLHKPQTVTSHKPQTVTSHKPQTVTSHKPCTANGTVVVGQ